MKKIQNPFVATLCITFPFKGEEDTTGEEEYGPHDMQSDRMPKEHRKKMIVAVMRRKMSKK